jgi:signal transduction histidine kinase
LLGYHLAGAAIINQINFNMSNSVRVSPNIQLLNDNENSIMDYLRSKKVSPCPVETRAPTFAELKNRRGDGEPGKYLSRSGKFSSSPQRELMSRGLSIKSAVVSMRHAAGIEDQSTKSSRINNDSFTAVYKHGHIGKFPWLYAPEVFSEYRIYQKSYFDIYSCIPQTAFFFAFLLTRCNMFTLTEGPYFQTSLSLFFVYILLNLFFYFVNGALFFASNSRSYLFRTARRLQKTWLGKNADDLLCLVGTILMSFVLLARVMKGECDKDLGTLTILDSSKCNSLGKFRQIPQGQVMAIYLVPIISQICLKGVTLQMNLCCWALGTAFIVAAVILVDGWKNEFWSILFSLLFLLVSFETERHSRIIFLESKRAAAAEAERGELFLQNNLHEISNERKRHDVLLVANAAEDEKRLMDREREQLTSLIGNVAHDLKTPLQSIRMDLELLKTTVIALVPSLVHKKEIVDYKSDTDDDTPLSIISSLNAACDFMSMAINRSIDFAKTSGGIALIPAMETFNINSALSVPVNVIKHLQSAIKIVVNPYPAGMCLNVISDKHWFTENILCLLSNAVKYSDGGTVDVIVELLEKFVNDDQTLSSNTKTEASKHGLFVRVSIEDNGIGLSKDDRENLFQPFKQAQRLAGGTGLFFPFYVFHFYFFVLPI